MLDIVNTYLGMWSKLTHADQWYSPPLGSGADRVGSMRWHRDYNDRFLVKVFVHLCDVDEATGPLEYVPGSTLRGPYAEEWPWRPLSELYPSQAEFERRIPASAARTLTGPEGSMIFCNTSGFHRGGHVTEKPRALWVFHYASPGALHSLVERNFDVGRAGVTGLPEVERFALT
jgi:ectoine hydroxylase-related dioxygenase (phytanoyl-CoA dioxygenase family)